jgi:hypothetical protein
MNRVLATMLAGAAGGAIIAFMIVALTKILVLDPTALGGNERRMQGQIDDLESRVERIELNSGQPNPKDAQKMGAPQRDAL